MDSVPRVEAGQGADGAQFTRPGEWRYRAFISYSHADTKWANWLMKRLEGYRVSARFHGKAAPIGTVARRIAPVFRDRDELPTTSDLGETIRAALRQSATLVVICSPRSAKSRWVQEEIVAFKRLHGERRVFAFIVEGEPKHAGAEDDCFSPALRTEVGADGELSGPPAEVVAADARPHGDGPKLAFTRLLAGLLGVGFDELRQRELQRRNRRLTWIAMGSALGMALTLGLAVIAWRARNDAQRRQEQAEDLLGFMLVDFRLQLEKAGRLELLESVGEKAKAYVDSLGARDLTDKTLGGKVKSLTVIGVVQVQKLRTSEAMRTFEEAHLLATAIARQHPADGGVLFDRAQVEYWLTHVRYNQKDVAGARTWALRYRDTAVALAGLDPANPRWQREAVSGHHNLAVIELEVGRLGTARAGFLGELPILERMSAADPKNFELVASIGNVDSYLGTIAERSGDYPEAIRRFEHQAARLESLVRAEPRTVLWQDRLANSYALRANVLAITGQRAAARALREQSRALLTPLIAADPHNRSYQRALLKVRVQTAMLDWAEGDSPAAWQVLTKAKAELEALHNASPGDRRTVGILAMVCRLEAELQVAGGENAVAAAAAARAIALLAPLSAKNQSDEEILGELFGAYLVAGRVSRALGDGEAAGRNWQRVVTELGERLRQTEHWRLLDPASRALAYLARNDESRELVERLGKSGYSPVEPRRRESPLAPLHR